MTPVERAGGPPRHLAALDNDLDSPVEPAYGVR
jgi:hypothetical protein